MLKFEYPTYLWLLSIIPLLCLLMILVRQKRKKALAAFGQKELVSMLMPSYSKRRKIVKFGLAMAILAMLIIALARPQMGTKVSNLQRNGIETVICLDISNSMLAQDVAPSRLEKSKMLVENLLDNFMDDKVALIVFAGDAFIQLPITADYVSAKMFLDNADPSMVSVQGTDIARAIEIASHSFTQQKNIGRAIVVITDGEDHEGGAEKMAEKAYKDGINVFILGVGDTRGVPIPVGDGEYLTDKDGHTVMTKLNEQMCKDVARAGNGTYIHVDNTSDAQRELNSELEKLQKGENNIVIYSEYAEQFQAFALIAIILMLIDFCMREAKNPKFENTRFGRMMAKWRVASKAVVVFILLYSAPAMAQTTLERQYIRQGNRYFNQKNYAKAQTEYQKALARDPKNSLAMYNLGRVLMEQNKDSLATVQFENAAKLEENPILKSQSFHNIGVICQKHQLYQDAIEAYKQCLRLNPNDDEARYNLALCKKLLKQKPPQKQPQQQNDKKQDDKNNDKNQKDKKDDKDNKDNKQNKDKKDNKQQPPQPENMSKETADRLLNAALQDEKATQQRMKQAEQQHSSRRVDRNW